MKMGNLDLNLCTFLCIMMLSSFVACQNSANDIDDNELGMGILYDMVHVFLEDVVHTKHISDSFLNLSRIFVDGNFQEDEVNQPEEWAEYLIGFAVCAAIGIVFILAMPIAGIIICCCRSCGKCGGKSHQHGSKRAKCKRRTYCTILLILNTVALAGIICAFISNSLLYKHLQDDDDQGSVGHLEKALKSVELLVNTSVEGGSEYVIKEYDDASAHILKKVNDTSSDAVDKVLKELNAKELVNQAVKISNDANKTAEELKTVSELLTALSDESNKLKQNLTDIKRDVTVACNGSCSGFNASRYDTNADFSSLDRMSAESQKVAESLNISRYVAEANQTLNEVIEQAKGQVQNKTQDASQAVQNVRNDILNGVADLKTEKDKALKDLPSVYQSLNDFEEDDLKKYSPYVYYGGIGVCCVYLLIIVLYYIGILYGMCGERPGHDAPCCNTGCGANFLIAGVAFTFIFSWLLMIICVVLFVAGGATQTEVCRYFSGHDPSKIEPFDHVIVNSLDLRSFYDRPPENLSIVEILQNCQRNQALFGAFHLDGVVDLDTIMNIQSLEDELQDLKNSIVKVDPITIISSDLRDSLEKLANSGLENINFTTYFEQLNKALTIEDLDKLAGFVDQYATTKSGPDKSSLENSAARLRQLHSETLPTLRNNTKELNNTLVRLQAQSTLKDAILALINNLTNAQNEFNTDKDRYIKEAVVNLADDILNYTKGEISKVKTDIRENLFGCQNLTTAMFTATDSVCILVVDPVNGLWFSFGWCLFFFVPCLIFALLLAGQYRIEHDYDKEFDDPHNMMYAGPNQDTIPLTSLEQAGRSGHHNRQSDPYGMSNAGYRDDRKRVPSYAAPPPYEDHMHPGIAAYAPSHQHHDLAQAYPALHGDGSYPASNGTKSTAYSYPY